MPGLVPNIRAAFTTKARSQEEGTKGDCSFVILRAFVSSWCTRWCRKDGIDTRTVTSHRTFLYRVMESSPGAPTRLRLGEEVKIMISRVRT